MIRIPVIACLALTAAVHAIGPGDFAAPTIHNGASNADFLAAVSNLSSLYYNSTGTSTAGATFSNSVGILPRINGQDAAVRVWFQSQEAGYENALGVFTVPGLSPSIVVPDSHGAAFGNYVDLNGGAAIHDSLSFFALSNIDSSGNASQIWVGPKFLNLDGKSHLNINYKSPFAYGGSLWYALALDDQFGGGDRDWNDLRVIIQLHPVAAPEPATLALFAGFLVIGLWLARRRAALAA